MVRGSRPPARGRLRRGGAPPIFRRMTAPGPDAPRTLLDKLWDAHRIVAGRDGGPDLLWVDRHFVHEGSFHGFDRTRARGLPVARPDLTFGVADHYVPTRGRGAPIRDAAIADVVGRLERNTAEHGIRLFGLEDPRQGIVHVIGPELGLTLPGLLIVCGDSHTATHGAYGALAFGIGASEVALVLMTGALWQARPGGMRVTVDGTLSAGVSAKDLALTIIARIGADGAAGHAVEYAGAAVRALTMEGRLTLCNMAIEGGARSGMVAPDEATFAAIRDREFAPRGDAFDRAVEDWRALATDAGAAFDREVALHADAVAPTVTWGVTPEDALPVTAAVPDPDAIPNPARAAHARAALDYMGLRPGQPIETITVDRVFIGSCTNARIEDLRAAAAVLAGRRARVPGLVSPGSTAVKRRAEEEGLDRVFTEAGLEWVESGCSLCVGMNGDLLRAGERAASTTNRNFRGRQGVGSRTHLMSPAMVAAAAVTGHLTDVRPMLAGRA